ncbi:PREDICTED: uncharacterized protein LOC109116602 [Tarenaya hassleriana]|uniref:uncharacterized protein LOC109116602 n=1 Tax=Tarenaya hassleriana TaxID=28532 RepID=UPI0008FD74F9|nr:PREDICTED: uncharacterized protein LOC109116602 [Tarenaya hassleriana]
MLAVVIIVEVLSEYTAALAKIAAGILPRHSDRRRFVRIGGISLPLPSSSSSTIPDLSSHFVDF